MLQNTIQFISAHSVASALAVGVVFFAILYWYLLPKPIPGDIPYDEESRRRILGDVPSFMKNIEVSKNPFEFLCSHIQKLQSPITQAWLKPGQRPIVIIADPQEAEDIMLRRTKEFDRGQFFKDIFMSNVPYHHIVQDTNEQFKAQRKFISDAMSPAFLRDISGPRVHGMTMELVELWRMKARLAGGRPFPAHEDLKRGIFDAIWEIAIGDRAGNTASQISYLSKQKLSVDQSVKDDPVDFLAVAVPGIPAAVELMIKAIGKVAASPVPQLHHRILRWFPELRAAYATKDREVTRLMELSRERFRDPEKQTKTAAVDYFLHRDEQRAEKIGGHLSEPVIRDELFGFLQAGHETTSTSLAWIVKFLSANPTVQTKLRSSLHTYFPATQLPSANDLASTPAPYLEAFIHECMRLGLTAPATTRTAIVDTTVLGHFVPKGTEVYMLFGGPGYMSPEIGTKPLAATHDSKISRNRWEASKLGQFDPERWIDAETGDFDPQAGPLHTFGLGIRGCWGKKLAFLQMKTVVTLLVLGFEFEQLPEELGDFKGEVFLTYEPRTCYVRLREL